MFSSRTNWNFLPNRLTQLLEQKRLRHETVIDLTESNPTRCGFRYDAQAIIDVLSQSCSLSYDPDPKGLKLARETVCRYYENKNVRLDPEQILLTASTSEAYSFLFKLLCNAGDSVLIPQPSYPLFEYLCPLNDVLSIPYHLPYDGEWHIDADSIRKGASTASRSVILVHPNNPTGSYIKRDEEHAIVQFAHEKRLSLIADEVFSEYDFGNAPQRVATFAAQEAVLTFTLGGVSKLLGLPQMKLAWIVVSGPESLWTEAVQRLELIADTYLSVHSAVQRALPQLFELQPSVTRQIRERLAANFELLRSATAQNSAVSLFSCDGGWSAILRLPRTRTDEEWCEHFLESSNILFHPGHFYSLEQESCLVVSLLIDSGTFAKAITQTFEFVASETAINTSLH